MRAAYERDGWAIARGVVPPDELAAMREVFLAIVPDVPYPPGPDGVLREVTGVARAYEPLARITRDARFGALAAEALGAGRVQLLQDSLLYKPAADGGPVEWHQDHTYLGFLVPPRVVTLRLALLPEDEANGCMRVVDGSHRWGPVGANRALREASVASLGPELTPAQREQLAHGRALALDPGDVSLHDGLAVHGSGPNRSERPRRTIILRMFDAACRLDPARIPPGTEAYFPVDADGHLDPTAFPCVFGG